MGRGCWRVCEDFREGVKLKTGGVRRTPGETPPPFAHSPNLPLCSSSTLSLPLFSSSPPLICAKMADAKPETKAETVTPPAKQVTSYHQFIPLFQHSKEKARNGSGAFLGVGPLSQIYPQIYFPIRQPTIIFIKIIVHSRKDFYHQNGS